MLDLPDAMEFEDNEASSESSASDKPKCKLVGEDGNAFAVIARVSRALKNAGQRDKATEWQNRAMSAESYGALLAMTFEYVEPY